MLVAPAGVGKLAAGLSGADPPLILDRRVTCGGGSSSRRGMSRWEWGRGVGAPEHHVSGTGIAHWPVASAERGSFSKSQRGGASEAARSAVAPLADADDECGGMGEDADSRPAFSASARHAASWCSMRSTIAIASGEYWVGGAAPRRLLLLPPLLLLLLPLLLLPLPLPLPLLLLLPLPLMAPLLPSSSALNALPPPRAPGGGMADDCARPAEVSILGAAGSMWAMWAMWAMWTAAVCAATWRWRGRRRW